MTFVGGLNTPLSVYLPIYLPIDLCFAWCDRRPCGCLAEASLRSSLRCSRPMPACVWCDRRPWPTRGLIILLQGSEAASASPKATGGRPGLLAGRRILVPHVLPGRRGPRPPPPPQPAGRRPAHPMGSPQAALGAPRPPTGAEEDARAERKGHWGAKTYKNRTQGNRKLEPVTV